MKKTTGTDTSPVDDKKLQPKKRSPRKKADAKVEETQIVTPAPESVVESASEKPALSELDLPKRKQVPEQFIADLGAFADILEKNPGILEPIREVFEYHLVDPIDRKTFPRIVNAMSMLLGASATMVVMTASHVNSAAFFEDLLYAVSKEDEKLRTAVWVTQHLTSIYGNRVQQAYTLSSGTMDDDWHTVDVNTFKREGDNEFWIIELNMNLYSGKEFKMRMTPDSIFQLTEILATELAKSVPKDQVDSALVEKCSGNFHEFFEKYYLNSDSKESKEDENPAGYA